VAGVAGEVGGGGSAAPPAGAVVGTAVAAPGGDTGVVVCVVSSVMAVTMADHPAPRLGATWEFPERAGGTVARPAGVQPASSPHPGSGAILVR
jgi:hypothetical protein